MKLVENISVLMFKPGFAVDVDPHSNFNKRRSMTGGYMTEYRHQ